MARWAGSTKKRHSGKRQYGLYDMAQTRGWNTENALAWGSCVTCHSSRLFIVWHTGTNTPWRKPARTHTHFVFLHDCFTIEQTGECLKCSFRLTGGVPAVVVQSEAQWARIPEIQVRIPSRAMGTFFSLIPSALSFVFLWRVDTPRPTQRRSLQMLGVAVPQIGVGVFHAWLFHDRADGWVSEVFVSTDGRRACRRGAIGSTMGAYPRDTGSNPVEGNGHFFPSYRQLYLSSFSDTPRPTQRRSLQMLGVAVPQIGVGVFHAWLFHDRADGWVSEVFVSTDGRRACRRGAIGSTTVDSISYVRNFEQLLSQARLR